MEIAVPVVSAVDSVEALSAVPAAVSVEDDDDVLPQDAMLMLSERAHIAASIFLVFLPS